MKKTYQTFLCLSAFVLLNGSSVSAGDDVHITMPEVVDAPEVKAIVVPAVKLYVDGQDEAGAKEPASKKEEIIFSKNVPPNYYKKESVDIQQVKVGEINNHRVPAYLRAPIISETQIRSNLETAGFTVLGTYTLDKKSAVKSVIFTDQTMTSTASKKTRGFAGTLRILIDEKSALISISNPIYVMRAFMQDEYDSALATQTLERLRTAFPGVENSKDLVKFSRLERYHFMASMPYYEDMEEVASGSNELLLKKARASKTVVYEQHLDNGSVVLGISLSKRTKKFVKKIGYENGGLLPYPVLIEDNKAKILAPKYYIAVMYPLLSMSEFMAIATTPGAIEKECEKIFR